MLSPTLVNVCAIFGVGLFVASFSLFTIFKDSVNQYEEEQLKNIVISEESKNVMDMIAKKEINYEIVQNFFNIVSQAYSQKKLLKQSWIFSLFSGVFFMLTALVGSVDSPFLPPVFSTAGLVYGVSMLLISVYYSIQLVSRIWER